MPLSSLYRTTLSVFHYRSNLCHGLERPGRLHGLGLFAVDCFELDFTS